MKRERDVNNEMGWTRRDGWKGCSRRSGWDASGSRGLHNQLFKMEPIHHDHTIGDYEKKKSEWIKIWKNLKKAQEM